MKNCVSAKDDAEIIPQNKHSSKSSTEVFFYYISIDDVKCFLGDSPTQVQLRRCNIMSALVEISVCRSNTLDLATLFDHRAEMIGVS